MTENKGCQVVLGLIGLSLVASMLLQGFGGPHQSAEPLDQTVFTIEGQNVSARELTHRVDQLSQSNPGARGTPGGELQLYSSAIESFVRNAALGQLARESGASVNELNVRSLAEQYAKQQLEQQKVQLLISGQLSPKATMADADKALEKMMGRPQSEFIKQFQDETEKQFKDSKTKSEINNELLPLALSQKYEEKSNFTEEQLRSSYEESTFEVIRFEDMNKPKGDREDEALKALDEIRSGTAFEAVQKKYNPNAKPDDRKVVMSAGLMDADETLAPLKKLKEGEVSDVLDQAGSPVLFKLISKKQNLPADFEQSKAVLLQQRRQSAATQALGKDFQAKMDSLRPKFKDQGLAVAYDTYRLLTDQTARTDRKKIEEQLDKVKKADISKSLNSGLAAASEYVLTETLYSLSTDEQKKAMMQDRVEAADRAFEFYEDINLRTRLASEFLDAGLSEDAVRYALAAINTADYEEVGQQIYSQVTDLVKKSGDKLTADQKQEIQRGLDTWLEAKVQAEKEKAELEAEEKKAQKELDSTVVEPKQESPKEEPKAGQSGAAKTGQ